MLNMHFTRSHRTFKMIDHNTSLTNSSSLKSYSMYSEYESIKSGSKKKKKRYGKSQNTEKVSNTLINNSWLKQELTKLDDARTE